MPQSWKNLSLRTKFILLFLFAIFIPVGFFYSLITYTINQSLSNLEREKVNQKLQAVSKALNDFYRGDTQNLWKFAKSQPMVNAAETGDRTWIRANLPNVASTSLDELLVVNADGTILYASPPDGLPELTRNGNLSRLPVFENTRGESNWRFFQAKEGLYFVEWVQVRTDDRADPNGTIYQFRKMTPSFLRNRKPDLRPGEEVTVAAGGPGSGRKTVVGSAPEAEPDFLPQECLAPNPKPTNAKNQTPNIFLKLRNTLYSWQPMKDLENKPVCLGASSAPEFSSSFSQDMVWYLAAIVVVGGLLAVVMVLFASGIIVGPVLVLTKAVRQITQTGDFSSPVVLRRDDELGELADSFNQLMKSVQESEKKLRERNRELTALHEVVSAVSQSLRLESTLNTTLGRILDTMAIEAGAFHLVDLQTKSLSLRAHRGLTPNMVQDLTYVPFGRGLEGFVVSTGESILLRNYAADFRRVVKDPGNFTYYACVPLKSKGEVEGVLSVYNREERPLTLEDLALLTGIGKEMGVAVENSRLYGEAEEQRQKLARRTVQLEAIYEATKALSAELTVELVLQTMVDRARELAGARYSALGALNEYGRLEHFITSKLPDSVKSILQDEVRGRTILELVRKNTTPIRIEDLSRQPYVSGLPADFQVKSFMGLPIRYRDRVIGVLYLMEKESGDGFEEDDENLVSFFAGGAGIALSNARLYQKVFESEQRYMDLYEHAPDMYQSLDRKGVILTCNETQATKLGYRKEKMVGQSFEKFIAPDSRQTHTEALFKVFQEGRVEGVEMHVMKSDGAPMFVNMSATLIRDEEGQPVMTRAILRDITEQKALEKQLFHSQKMESLGTLAGGIAHDFNNLMAGIIGFASLLKSRLPQGTENFRQVEFIENTARKGAELTQQLLAFARGGKTEARVFDVHRQLDQAVGILSRTLQKKIDIHMKLEAQNPAMEGDEGQIQQAFLNICINARDAMPEGGRLFVETRNIGRERLRPSLGLNVDEAIRISIQDTGIGMDENTKAKIFEPFFTTKKQGTGLGLAVVYGIVKNHGGAIEVQSEPGKGTTFLLYFPSSTKPIGKATSAKPVAEGGNELILVVDDEAVVRNFLKESLESKGYRVMLAKNGKEGVETYKGSGKDIALVILDIIMPEMTGEEALAHIREINPEAKILITTGFAHDPDRNDQLSKLAQGYLQKPFDHQDLLLKVREVLDGKPAARQPSLNQ